MKIIETYNSAKHKFIAKELIKFINNISEEKFVFCLNDEFDKFDIFNDLYNKFLDGMPLEYITNKAYFFDMEFFVDERVLIPRFETEILVNKCIKIAKNFTKPKILEIGTGSGIISVALSKALPNSIITAVDISDNALEVARMNFKKHNAKINVLNSDLDSNINDEKFDIIVSNPPYISNSYNLDKWVLKEPKLALIGGEFGDEIIKKIIDLSIKRAKFLCIEMGYDQLKSLKEYLIKKNFKAHFYRDLAGFDRGFIAKNENF